MDSSVGWLKDYNFISFETTTSTNDEALNLARENILSHYVISTKYQSLGRGSKEKSWISTAGNLYFSILLSKFDNISNATIFPFMMANVIAEVIEKYIPISANLFLELKWPNDILLNKKKIAGILVESISVEGINYVVIGVGININNYPMINNRQIIPSSLLNEGIKITDEQKFFNQLINQFNDKYKMWLQDKNFTPIKNAWLSRAYKLGSEINMKLDGETRRGIFRGIAMDGRLIMQMLNNGDMIYYHNGELT